MQWAGLMLFWMLFVFRFSAAEFLLGAAASALGVLALRVACTAVPLCFQPRARWVAQAWRLPAAIARDLAILIRVLARRIVRGSSRGVWRQAEFHTSDDCHGSAQRALAVLFLTTPPNSIVVDLDQSHSRMLFHELSNSPLPAFVRKLEE
jgi:multisubunit Na+/H+ antiporter MnhE subunit